MTKPIEAPPSAYSVIDRNSYLDQFINVTDIPEDVKMEFTADVETARKWRESLITKGVDPDRLYVIEVPWTAFKHEYKFFQESDLSDNLELSGFESDAGAEYPFAQEDGTFTYTGGISQEMINLVKDIDIHSPENNQSVPVVSFDIESATYRYIPELLFALKEKLVTRGHNCEFIGTTHDDTPDNHYRHIYMLVDNDKTISSFDVMSKVALEETLQIVDEAPLHIGLSEADLIDVRGLNPVVLTKARSQLENPKSKLSRILDEVTGSREKTISSEPKMG